MADFYKIYNYGGTDTINANNTEFNAKIYPLNGTAANTSLMTTTNLASFALMITFLKMYLVFGADYEAATSVYKADGKTYVDIFGANNQSIEKSLPQWRLCLTEFKVWSKLNCDLASWMTAPSD